MDTTENLTAAMQAIEAKGTDDGAVLKIAATIDFEHEDTAFAVHGCKGSGRVGFLVEVPADLTVRKGEVLELSLPPEVADDVAGDLKTMALDLKPDLGKKPASQVGLDVLREIAMDPAAPTPDRISAASQLVALRAWK